MTTKLQPSGSLMVLLNTFELLIVLTTPCHTFTTLTSYRADRGRSSCCAAWDGLKVKGGAIFSFFLSVPHLESNVRLCHMLLRADQPQFLNALLASEKGLNFKFQKIKGAENKDFIGWGWEVRLKALLENLPLRFALVLQYLFGLSQEPSRTSFTSASEHAGGVYTRPAK